MPGLHFDITGNNSDFLRKLDETQRGISQTSKKIESEGTSIENYFNKLAKGAATLGLGFSAAQLVKDIVEVRGQFQQLEIAFETMLKNKEKASALMAQLTETAAKTPFDLQSVSQGAKQLLAYGTASEEVNDTLIRLGNIASGLSIPLGDLVYLYGTTQTQGRLFTQDVRQFMGRGIPLVKELAAELGKTEQQINEMVTAGKIGFTEVEKVIRNMTSESGQFYNLMEKQSASLTGQISNLGDAWDGMLNKIGTQTQGIASSGISAVTSLIENYETAGKVLAGLVVTYGTYKAAIILLDVWKARDIALDYAKLMITGKLTVAQSLLNKTMLANPYVLLATAVVGAVAAMWAFHDSTTAAERISKSATDTMDRMAESSQKLKGKIDGLLKTIRDEASTQYDKTKAYKQLQEVMPTVFSNMDIETLKLMNHLSLNKQINEELNRREIIGAKTNVVLAQKRYDKAAAKYQKDIDNGLVGAGSLSEKSTAFVELETAKKVLSEIEKIQSEARKKKEEDSKKEPTHNKEYWENLKKETQSQLDALSDIEAASKKGAALKQKIAGYDKKINAFSTNTSKQDNQAKKLLQQQEKYNLLMDKQKREQERMETDFLHELEQIEINALQEGGEKILRQRALNHQKELEAIKREAKDKKLKVIEEARSAFEANPDKKKGTFDAEEFVKSEPVKKQFAVFDKVAESKVKTEETKYNRGDDLAGLLSEYQDYTDKRLAIETKFNEDIAILDEQRKAAVQSGDTQQVEQIDRAKAQATANKGKELMGLDYEKLKESPEYVRAFENLKETSSETLNSLLSQLENAKVAAAKVLSPDQLREYTTTIQEIMDELDSRNPFQALTDKKNELAEAEQELANAQIELENAKQTAEAVKGGAKIENGVTSSKFNAKTGKIESTKAYLSEAQALAKVKEKTDKYNAAKDKVVQKDAKVKKSEKEVRSQIDELSKSISEVGDAIGGPAGEIISLIGNIGTFALTAMSGVEAAADTSANAISTVEKASVILMIIGAAIQVATKMLDLFGGDDTTEKYEKTKEAYESYINILDKVIDKQLELAETLTGDNANAAYEKAIELIKTQSEAAKVLGKQYLDSGASWKSHSKGYEEVDGMSWEGWSQAAQSLGMSVSQFKNAVGGRMTGLFDLTDEQLAKLSENAPIFWSQLDSDTQKYANQVVDGVSKVAEVMEQKMQDVTLIDVDTLRSDFQDLLTDMDSDTADFADNFEEYMRNAILNSMLKESYMDRLKKWREKFYNAMDDGMTQKEYEDLKAEGQQISDEMRAERDQLKDMFGWTSESDSSQESTNKGFQAMSQDTGNELNGRFTALQISNEEIKNQMITLNQITASLLGVNQTGFNELVNLRIQANSYLEDIAGFQKRILEILKSDLGEIKRNSQKL